MLRSMSKEQMMDRVRIMFSDCDFLIPKTEFEHIADAFGAYMASEGGVVKRVYG